MDPISPCPIVPMLPDVGRALLVPLRLVGVGALAGVLSVVALVLRGRLAERPRPAVVLDVATRPVVEGRRAHGRRTP